MTPLARVFSTAPPGGFGSAGGLRRRRLSPFRRIAAPAALLLLCLPALLSASGATAWEMNSFTDFLKGRFNGVSLSRDGRLTLGPKLDPLFASDQPVVWRIDEGPDGTLYAATGNRGRVYKIDRSGQASVLLLDRQYRAC